MCTGKELGVAIALEAPAYFSAKAKARAHSPLAQAACWVIRPPSDDADAGHATIEFGRRPSNHRTSWTIKGPYRHPSSNGSCTTMPSRHAKSG